MSAREVRQSLATSKNRPVADIGLLRGGDYEGLDERKLLEQVSASAYHAFHYGLSKKAIWSQVQQAYECIADMRKDNQQPSRLGS
jgi:hypothetical protein